MHIYFFPIYFDQTQFSLRAIRTYIFRISNTYSYISQFPNFSLLQMLYFVLTHFVSAGTAVAPPSFLHPPLLLQLYVSAVLLHCLIKLHLKYMNTDCTRVSQLCFPFLLSSSSVAACRSEMRDSRGQDCKPIPDWISGCLLSVILHVLGKSLCFLGSVWHSDWQEAHLILPQRVPLGQKTNEAFHMPPTPCV